MRARHGIRFLGLVLGILFSASGLLYAMSVYDEPTLQALVLEAKDFNELRDRVVAATHAEGAVKILEWLEGAELPENTDLHLLAHAIGDVLYAQEGIEGIARCTPNFRNACSHAIVINALYEHGEEVIERVRAACQAAPGGIGAYTMCFHGFGHGVFTYFDFDIPRTISYCKRAGTENHGNREYIECVGGAIMELAYQIGEVEKKESIALDPIRSLALYDPVAFCLSTAIPEDVKLICITYITPLILKSVGLKNGEPDSSVFAAAFKKCEVIPQQSRALRYACFGSFGKEFTPLAVSRDIRRVDRATDDIYRDAQKWCALARNDLGERACISEAVGSLFWGGENDSAASFRFCTLAEGDAQNACYERLAQDISMFIHDSRREDLCRELSQRSTHQCHTP
jgi:hypothetical protein